MLLVTLAWGVTASAQVDLLPIEHPATGTLLRLADAGVIPAFPAEHLPISRRAALQWIDRALSAESLPDALRHQAAWYRVELAADIGAGERDVVIPVMDHQRSLLTDDPGRNPFTGILWIDSARDSRAMLDPILDGEVRIASGQPSGTTGIAQGGVRLRGSVRSIFGFSAAATNGTILGSEEVARDDPRLGSSFKFGRTGLNRDIDFGSGHARFDLDGAAVGIAREWTTLGVGRESTLLFGGQLPSRTDWLRLGFRVGTLDYTHIHASLMGEAPEGADDVGPFAEIPTKYLAAHLLSIGPVGPLRFSVGEAVVYGGRPFEIGYLNPVNFLKSQEHYLRDRDNSLLYLGLRAWPVSRVRLEGEFLLDDLVFSRIGTGYWGNKTAWRIGVGAVGLPYGTTDLLVEYTRLEPYVYSHFARSNAYLHDGALPAARGNEPNSHALRSSLTWRPIPNLTADLSLVLSEHGRNVVADTGLVRNVGGDVREGFRSEVSADTVTFLDGVLEQSRRIEIDIRYEVIRNVYLRLRGFLLHTVIEELEPEQKGQIWFGLRIGAL